MPIYIISLALCGLLLIVLYFLKHRNLPISIWKPGAAWLRAGIYFVVCNIISASTGTLAEILRQPIIESGQLSDPGWVVVCGICFIYIFIAYWILWARLTITFDRKFYLGSEIVFGIIWGLSTGQVLLSFYHLWQSASIPGWAIYLLSYVTMGLWMYVVQDYFWDIYVSPEHDTPRSIRIKTLVSHVPNVAICLFFLYTYGNYTLFVFTQTFALVAASIFQRFPAPWAMGQFNAPKTRPGLFGMPRGAGYTE